MVRRPKTHGTTAVIAVEGAAVGRRCQAGPVHAFAPAGFPDCLVLPCVGWSIDVGREAPAGA